MDEQQLAALYPPLPGILHRHTFYPLEPVPAPSDAQPQQRLAICGFQSPDGTMFASFWGEALSIKSVAISQRIAASSSAEMDRYTRLLNHVVTVLRFLQNSAINIVRVNRMYAIAVVEDDSPVPLFNPLISASFATDCATPAPPGQINWLTSVTLDTPLRPLLALLAEGLNEQIPGHYRILSLLRAIETFYPNDLSGRKAWVNSYASDWQKLELGEGSFFGSLEEIRSRCAHGWPRGGGDPYVGIAVSEARKLDELLDLLLSMVIARMNEMAPEGLSFSPPQPNG